MDTGAVVYAIRVTADGAAEALGDVTSLFEQVETSAQKAGKGASQGTAEMGRSANEAALGYAALAAAAAKAFQTVVGAVGSGIDAYNAYIVVQQKLAHVMRNTMGASPVDVSGITSLIAAQQKLGVVSEQAQTAGAQELATYLSLGDSMKKLIPVMNDMAAQQFGVGASAEQVTNIATMLGKVMDGQVGGLSRYGYSFTEAQEEILKTGDEMERVAVLAEVVGASVGGMNEALAQTDAGKMWQAAEAGEALSRSFGEAMAPAIGLGSELMGGFLALLNEFAQTMPGVTAGATAATVAFAGMAVVQKAATALKSYTGAATLAEAATKLLGATAKTSFPVFGLIAAAVGVAIGAYSSWKRAQEEAAEAAKEEIAAYQDSATAAQGKVAAVQSLASEYQTLSAKEGKTIADKTRMKQIENELAAQHGITGTSVEGLAGQYDSLAASIQGYIQAQQESITSDRQAALDAARQLETGAEAIADARERIAKINESIARENQKETPDPGVLLGYQEAISTWEQSIADTQAKYADNLATQVEAGWDVVMDSIQRGGMELTAGMQAVMRDIFEWTVAKQGTAALSEEFISMFSDMFSGIPVNDMFAEMMEGFAPGEAIPEDKIAALKQSLISAIASAREESGAEYGALTTGEWNEIFSSLLVEFGIAERGAGETAAYIVQEFSAAAETIGDLTSASDPLAEALKNVNTAMSETGGTVKSLEDIQKGYKDIQDEIKALEAVGGNEKRIAQLQEEARNLSQQFTLQQRLLGIQKDRLLEEQKRLQELADETDNPKETLESALKLLEIERQISDIDIAISANISSINTDDLSKTLEAIAPIIKSELEGMGPVEVEPTVLFKPSVEVDEEDLDLGWIGEELSSAIKPETPLGFADFVDIESFDLSTVDGVADALGVVTSELAAVEVEISNLQNMQGPFTPAQEAANEAKLAAAEAKQSALQTGKDLMEGWAFNTTPAKQTLSSLLTEFKKTGDAIDKAMGQVDAVAKLDKALKSAKTSTGQMTPEVKKLAREAGYFGDTFEGAQGYLEDWMQSTDDAEASVENLKHQILSLLPNMVMSGELSVDTAAAIAAMVAASKTAEDLKAALESAGVSTNNNRRGGGSKKKDTSAEDAAKAQQKAYDDALEAINRKRRMDQISAQEEIALLEEVARVHAQTTAQRLDIEEKLYKATKQLQQDWFDSQLSTMDHLSTLAHQNASERLDLLMGELTAGSVGEEQQRNLLERIHAARAEMYSEMMSIAQRDLDRQRELGEISVQEEIERLQLMLDMYAYTAEQKQAIDDQIFAAQLRLRSDESSSLDKLHSGIVTALRNRYQEQRDMEQKHLDASIQAWKDWSDETVAAIQAQIDALEDAAKQESRDEKEQKALRKIASLQMELEYETDDYKRYQLEKEIARQQEELAKQRRDWAREDEKALLKEEIQAVKDKAQEEQEKIKEQKEALNEVYNELTQSASLKAEAEKMLVSANQDEILDLIGSYAPEYEATGKTLGEKLWGGLQDIMDGGVTKWMESFTSRIEDIQSRLATTANQFAQQYYNGQLTSALVTASAPADNAIEQTVYINSTVAKPSEVAEALEEANEALIAQLLK